MTLALPHFGYFGVIVLFAMMTPPGFLGDPGAAKNAIIVVGFLGAWRYSWALLNFSRAIIFKNFLYEGRKARAEKRFAEKGAPCHAYFMVTSYMVPQDVSLMVYRSIFDAAANAKDGATILSSVVEGADERLIREVYNTMPRDMSRVTLIMDRIKPAGKGGQDV